MKKQLSKSVSSLDLKLLDIKFIAIDDNQLYLTEVMHSVRKAKLTELPSLLMSKDNCVEGCRSNFGDSLIGDVKNGSTLESICQLDQSTMLSSKFRSSEFSYVEEPSNSQHLSEGISFFRKKVQYESCQDEVQMIKQQIQTRKLLNINKTVKSQANKSESRIKQSIPHQTTITQSDQQIELEKYRTKIELIKKQNLLIHKQISSLYRNKINQNNEPLKKIRKIEPFSEEKNHASFHGVEMYKSRQHSADIMPMKRMWELQKVQKVVRNSILPTSKVTLQTPAISKKLSSCPLIREKMNFYENLTEKSPYKQELQNIHKKIISNNLHKNFEQYLVTASKRVPEFIRKLRN